MKKLKKKVRGDKNDLPSTMAESYTLPVSVPVHRVAWRLSTGPTPLHDFHRKYFVFFFFLFFLGISIFVPQILSCAQFSPAA
jgi:hypothetical protein